MRREYDAKQVEKLKDTLLGVLKNASNIRNLKSDESVTLVVSSGEGHSVQTRLRKLSRMDSGGGSGGSGSSSGGGSGVAVKGFAFVNAPATSGSVLTIKARKSDMAFPR